MEIIDLNTEAGQAMADEIDRLKAEKAKRGQQLYAKIKRSSKYFHQNDFAKSDPERWGGFPFKVFVDPRCGEYSVQGGPGGQYRMSDVNLYVLESGRELRIS